MDDEGFCELTAATLRDYLTIHREKDFLLVDVRQPLEYELGHIPGASFMPLSELESRLFSLPRDKALIFYCRTGSRSVAAASLAAEGEVTDREIFSLAGGILAWEGKTLPGFPRVRAFDKGQGAEGLLYTAMDLEKGAWRFYRHLLGHFADDPIGATIDTLSQAETAHARMIYRYWHKITAAPPPFDALFEKLPGEILGGGERLEDMLRRVDHLAGNHCLNVIEIALHIEYSAYDLYRTTAGQVESSEAREALLSISQAEKAHMRTLTRHQSLLRKKVLQERKWVCVGQSTWGREEVPRLVVQRPLFSRLNSWESKNLICFSLIRWTTVQ